ITSHPGSERQNFPGFPVFPGAPLRSPGERRTHPPIHDRRRKKSDPPHIEDPSQTRVASGSRPRVGGG
ncbi:MAG TPA: hypothetical protein VNZ53_18795, partial [Steroidobacteraceae bacterium]|nr:hypothetical protein [Steroidobacteraceae bacterium]